MREAAKHYFPDEPLSSYEPEYRAESNEWLHIQRDQNASGLAYPSPRISMLPAIIPCGSRSKSAAPLRLMSHEIIPEKAAAGGGTFELLELAHRLEVACIIFRRDANNADVIEAEPALRRAARCLGSLAKQVVHGRGLKETVIA